MEQQKLPNATLILILSIGSLLCCCVGGIGVILAIIALVLANKSIKIYKTEPELYDNYNSIKTGRIIAIVGIVLNVIYFIYTIIIIATYGVDGIMEQYQMQDGYQF
ncbi:CCC motif membrane protein [Sinomicrobium sp. M5D2P17]